MNFPKFLNTPFWLNISGLRLLHRHLCTRYTDDSYVFPPKLNFLRLISWNFPFLILFEVKSHSSLKKVTLAVRVMKCVNLKTTKSCSSSSNFQGEKWKMRDKRTKICQRPQLFFYNLLENFYTGSFSNFFYKFLLKFVLAYRKGYSANHLPTRLIENWKWVLDKNLFTWAVLIDLSKAFDFR